MQHISLRACFVFLPFRILDGIVRRPLLYGRDLLQPLHQMLIVDHVLRLRRVGHVVRVLPANPANGGAAHGNAAAASSTRPIVRPHEDPSRAGDGGKAAAGRRDAAAAAAAEGLLLLLQLKVGQLQRLLNRRWHCLCHLGL